MIEFTISLRTFAIPRVWKIPMEKRTDIIHRFAEHPSMGVLPPVLFVYFPKKNEKRFFSRRTRKRNTPAHPRRSHSRQRKNRPVAIPSLWSVKLIILFNLYYSRSKQITTHFVLPHTQKFSTKIFLFRLPLDKLCLLR